MPNHKLDLNQHMALIDRDSKHKRTIFYIYITLISYSLITILGTTDVQLVSYADKVRLPILDVSIPLTWFFFVAPILCMIFYSYFALYFLRVNLLIKDIDQSHSEIRSDLRKKYFYPWFSNIVYNRDSGFKGFLEGIILAISLWTLLPLTSSIIAYKFAKIHNSYSTYLIFVLPVVSGYLTFWFWNELNGKRVNDKTLVYLSMIFLCSFSIVIIPEINLGAFDTFNLQLRNAILVTVPKKDEISRQKYWTDLERRNLNGANLNNAVLQRANLSHASISKANLENANLKEAYIHDVNLQGSRLSSADFSKSVIVSSNLTHVSSYYANFQGADIQYANFSGSNFGRGNFENAKFDPVIAEKADFARANLKNARFYMASFSDTNLSGANLQGIYTYESPFRNADLSNAQLQGAILGGVLVLFSTIPLNCNDVPDLMGLDSFDLRGAYIEGVNFSYADLQNASLISMNLDRANFFDANLTNVNFAKADLSNSHGLILEQICKAGTLYSAKINEELLKNISDNELGCPEKLTKDSYEKWYRNECRKRISNSKN